MSEDEDPGRPARERLRDAIEREYLVFLHDPEEDDDPPDASMLTKMLVLAEWRGTDGKKRLGLVNCDATGDRMVTWEVRGLLHEALYYWPEPD